MGDARKAGRKELAYGCRRSEGAPQANEPKRSAHLYVVRENIATVKNNRFRNFDGFTRFHPPE
jgi:hypothetical protein